MGKTFGLPAAVASAPSPGPLATTSPSSLGASVGAPAPTVVQSHAETFLDTAKQELGDFWKAHGADIEKGLVIGASAFAAAELLKTLKNAAFGKE